MKKIFTFLLLAAVSVTAFAEKELYGVKNGTTLTIYYDSNRESKGGVLEWWDDDIASATTEVTFDAGVAEARPTSTDGWFIGFEKLTAINGLTYLNTSEVTSMSEMFNGCYKLTSLDVSNFNTSKVTNMKRMFGNCQSLTALDVSNFNTGNATNIGEMFSGCLRLTSLDLSNFNTSNVKDMSGLFSGCESLASVNLSSFNTSNVRDMYLMFNCCLKLTSLDLSSFNTSEVTEMSKMFWGCTSLKSLDLSSFNTSKVLYMQEMFYNCESLTSVNLSSFNTSEVTWMAYMFNNCKSLTSIDLSGFHTSNVKNMAYMFYGCQSLTELDVSGFDISKVTSMNYMFQGCSNLQTVYCNNNWGASSTLANSKDMFKGCTKLKGDDPRTPTAYDASIVDKTYARPDKASSGKPGYFSKPRELYGAYSNDRKTFTIYYDGNRIDRDGILEWWNEDNSYSAVQTVTFDASVADARPTSTAKWFCDFSPLKTINGLAYLNTSEVTRMDSMFARCNILPSLDLSTFNTEKVTDMTSMFEGCNYLTELNLSSFNTSRVEDMYLMFGFCTKLTSLDLTNFNTSKVRYMDGMFFMCSDLETIYCNDNWGASTTLLSSRMMFSTCPKLKGGNKENPMTYDDYKTDAEYARPDRPAAGQPGYFTPTVTIPDENPILELEPVETEPGKETAITFTLDGASSSAVLLSLQATDTYDESKQCVVLKTTLDDANVAKLMDNILKGFGDFYSVFSGVSFFLPAGKGEMKLDIQTFGLQLSVHIGNSGVAHLTQNTRGEAVVQYDITEPTLVCIHASAPAAGAPARYLAPQQTNAETGVQLYGIKIKPNKNATGFDASMVNDTCQNGKFILGGHLYILRDGEMYNAQGARVE